VVTRSIDALLLVLVVSTAAAAAVAASAAGSVAMTAMLLLLRARAALCAQLHLLEQEDVRARTNGQQVAEDALDGRYAEACAGVGASTLGLDVPGEE
jgi:hypothetical protein